ncbi:MAG TPA: leucyl/phenylalanyl-tRNA--protein transferase [Polyangiaceae bacterium]|nr:leucyl/phenylalanyl-tRNA--protein transferase [Polyangiaceae bacterium]
MTAREPIEPPATDVKFPDPARVRGRDIVAVGTDYRPGTILQAYRLGIFPWPQDEELVGWFSPDPRAILPLDTLHWSRSLRRTLRHHPFRITVDQAFRRTMQACGEQREGGTWITPGMLDGYEELHRLGWAHSLEVWEPESEELVGGIYGIAIGAAFAGESMFHRRTDASKIAFANLAERLRDGGYELFDVQVMNPHLASLGCVEIPRAEYLRRLARAIAKPPPHEISAWA